MTSTKRVRERIDMEDSKIRLETRENGLMKQRLRRAELSKIFVLLSLGGNCLNKLKVRQSL